MAWRVGVNSGGTFTDVCLCDDATGRIEVWKVSSTPEDPSLGIATGVAEAIARVSGTPSEITWFGHGTTVATNALIQHRGARTGLITTDGFRDLLEIGRQKRPDLYDLMVDKPVPLVSRDLRLEVLERLRHDGSVERALDQDGLSICGAPLAHSGCTGNRSLLSVRFHQYHARSNCVAYCARGIPRSLYQYFPRRRPGVSRIRTPVDHRGQRLSWPGDACRISSGLASGCATWAFPPRRI